MTPRPLRTALVGFGTAGRLFHSPLLAAVDGLVVTDVVTSDPGRAEAARAAHGDVSVHASYDALWESAPALDLVVLATPNAGHVEQARAAVRRGVAVVVDKPLALDAASAAELVAEADAAGARLTVFQNRRWDPAHLTAQRLLREGALGAVVRHEARFERWRPQPKERWREQLPGEQGGGLLLDLQSHLVDGAVQLFGPVASVHAELAALSTVADDVTFLALRHASGVSSHLSATSLAGAPGPRLRLLGREGAYVVAEPDGDPATGPWVDADDAHRGWLVRGEESEPVRREPGGWVDFYVGVVAWLRGEGPVPVDPHDPVHVLQVLDAARLSASTGRTVPIGA